MLKDNWLKDILSKKRAIAPTAACVFAGLLAATIAPAAAMVGGAEPAADGTRRSLGMILSSYGTACTETAIARDLLLTAAHCV